MRRITLSGTTDTAGACTVTYEEALTGLVLYAVQLVDSDLSDGVDITLTCENGDLSIPLLSYANFNVDLMVYPRVAEANGTDGTASGGTCMPLIFGKPKMVIAQGGATHTAKIYLWCVEL